ncbi:amidohydrolase family protein [Streptosporangium sp. G11]|uniref:amidohydrolase family protein n=1 Tax=Streptosporangium sp. G11 TaxID=3436926 RepID=UPI003EBFA2AC
MTDPRRVDVHQHFVPEEYARWLRAEGMPTPAGHDLPAWSPAEALAFMDRHGVATGILSLTFPGVRIGDGARARGTAREKARVFNELGAELVKDHPGRFGLFATLTLPDVDGAVAEAVHALDELGADGVVLLANSRGTYLGDPAYDPLMAELDRRHALVFVHPAELPASPVPGIPPFAVDFLLDTTRAGARLVRNDVPRRFPGIRFVMAHAGGFIPYAAYRIAATVFAETGRDPDQILDELSSFYFDTALSGSPAALPSLLAFAKPGHVLYGSDWPFAPEIAVGYFNGLLDGHSVDEATRAGIHRDNALALLPRLAKRPGL